MKTTAIPFDSFGLEASGVQRERGKQVIWWKSVFLVSETFPSLQCCLGLHFRCSRLSGHEIVLIDGGGVAQSLAKSHSTEVENKPQPWRLLLLPIRHEQQNAGSSLHPSQESHRKMLAHCNVSDFDFPVMFCWIHRIKCLLSKVYFSLIHFIKQDPPPPYALKGVFDPSLNKHLVLQNETP